MAVFVTGDTHGDFRRFEKTTAYMWISNKIQEFAERIYTAEKEKLTSSVSIVLHHLI